MKKSIRYQNTLYNNSDFSLSKKYRKELHIVIRRYIYRAKNYKNYGDSHIEGLEKVLTDFANYIHHRHSVTRYRISKITIQDIESYIIEVSEKKIDKSSRYFGINTKLHPSTVSWYLSIVRGFFRYCVRVGVSCIDPGRIESRKAERAKILVLTDSERQELFDCPTKYEFRKESAIRNLIFIKMLYYTGCRISEIIGLKFSDIDPGTNQIQIRGKWGKIRGVFITDEIRSLISEYKTARQKPRSFRGRMVHDEYNTDNIFISHAEQCFGKPCTIRTFQDMFSLYRKKMGTKKPITAHILRHTFATDLMKRGGDVRVVQIMLGHNFLDTTMRYTHVNDSMLINTHKLLSTESSPIFA